MRHHCASHASFSKRCYAFMPTQAGWSLGLTFEAMYYLPNRGYQDHGEHGLYTM